MSGDVGLLEVVETIEHLDFDVPCLADDGPAAWSGRASCCGRVLIVCIDCRLYLDAYVKPGDAFCRECGHDVLSIAWVPIKGANA